MKIIVTGGAGFIGSNVCEEAIKKGHEVVVFDNLWRPGVIDNVNLLKSKYKDKYQFIWGDVRNSEDIELLPSDADAIIHLAANPGAITAVYHPVYDFKSNAEGTFNILEWARKKHMRVIYASTSKTMSDIINEFNYIETPDRYELDSISESIKALIGLGVEYEEQNNKPVAITDKFPIDGFCRWGHSPYGISKLTGELYCQEFHVTFGLSVVIFRMSCIYGIYQKGIEEQGWVAWFLKQINEGDGRINIFGTGKQVRDILDGRDVARAYIKAAEMLGDGNIDGQIFTMGGGTKNAYSLLEVIKKIEEITGKKAKLTFKDKRPADQDWYISSIIKAKALLDWQPEINLDRALQDMLKQ